MKPIKTIRILVLLAVLAAGAVGCQKEELPATGGDAPQGTPLAIHVVDGGYTASSAQSSSATRATEKGYTTKFTTGDQIGLYTVVNNAIVATNICLTATNNGAGGVNFTGNVYYENAATKYFAYYPYQSSLAGTLNASATDAAGFFADVVSQWTPATVQSTHALYTAQDLMVGSSTISRQGDAYTLLFALTHTMALVVIETPMTKYTLSTDATYSWDAPAAPDTRFIDFTPCFIDGKYRYLVKPGQSGATNLKGSYTSANGSTKEYAIAQNDIAAANYAHYTVDGGAATIIPKTHTLQVGDFYLKDGSLLGKDENLTAAQQADCLGIVFKVGKDGDGSNWKDDCAYKTKSGGEMSTIRGYVLALHDASGGVECRWGSDGTKVEHADMNREKETGFYGYKNTNAIKAFAQLNGKTLQKDFPATYHATVSYEASYPAPASSSGWFLPSGGQCKYWLSNKDVLLASVKKATGESGYNWKSYYWSSSEDDLDPAHYACVVYFFPVGKMEHDRKNTAIGNYIRSLFAF